MSGRVRGPGRIRSGAGAERWWRTADLALIAGLVVLGSLLLVPAYGSAAPVAAAVVGAAVPAVVLACRHRWTLPWWLAAPLILLGVLGLGALVVEPQERALAVLPSVDAVAAVLRGSVDAWRDLLTVATPVGVSGGLLVPPLLIAAAGTTVAGVLLGTGRPVLALSGPAAAAVAFAMFGDVTAAPPAVALVVAGALLVAGLTWVVWIGGRARHRARIRAASSDEVHSAGVDRASAGRRVVTSAAILTAAAAVAGLVASAGTADRVALRAVVQAPVEPVSFASPLALFRGYTKDRADDVQLVVQGLPTGARLRLAALDDYDGRQFRLSNDEGPFVRIGHGRPAPLNTAPVQVTVQVRDYRGTFLPLPGPIVGLDFDGPHADELAEDLRYSEAASTGLMPAGWQAGDGYRVVAAVPAQPTPDQLAASRPLPVLSDAGATLPDMLRSTADRFVAGASTPAAQVEAIRAGLAAAGMFSHGSAEEPRSPAGHGLDRLLGMVGGGSMVGDQEQYAALMALLVRSIGIPARVVVGFAPSGSTGGEVTLRGRDITAWVEVPFQGFGWVAFDPTPSPDKPVTETEERAQTERREVAVEVPPALPQVQPDAVDTESADQQPQDPEPPALTAGDTFMPALLLAMAGWTLLVVAVLAAPIVAILAVKSRRRRRRLTAPRPADRVTGGWQELVDTATDVGYRPVTWHTRAETARDLARAGVLQVDWLAPAADAAQFSPTPVDDERARGYWREVDDRSAELLGGLGFWRRWRSKLSLASLRRRDD